MLLLDYCAFAWFSVDGRLSLPWPVDRKASPIIDGYSRAGVSKESVRGEGLPRSPSHVDTLLLV